MPTGESLHPHPEALLEVDRHYIVPWGHFEAAVSAGVAFLLVLLFGYLCLKHSYLWGGGIVVALAFGAFFVLFFRNPARAVPMDAGVLVSPADGTIWDIEEVEENDFIGQRCLRIGIFLSVFDVHLNRAPADGEVAHLQHQEGAYHDARSSDASSKNESNSIGIVRSDRGGPDDVKILVKQISGAIARRIVCPLTVGEPLRRGALMGMIKYGSRTELYVPLATGVEARVKVKDKVTGGVTVLAAWPAAEGAAEEAADGD